MASLKDEIHKREPFRVVEQEAFLNLLRTTDALTREMDAVFKPVGLSPVQYNVLRILRGAGKEGMPCGRIIEHMITRDPDLTRLLDRMEKRELISRWRDRQDRRVVRAKIAPPGLKLLDTLDEPLLEIHRRQFTHMSQADLKQLVRLLETAREHADNRTVSCQGNDSGGKAKKNPERIG